MLLTKEVEITLNVRDIKHYESLGYAIPKRKDNKGRMTTPRSSKLVVKTKDLTKGSHAVVEVECDYCHTRKNIEYREYLKHHDNALGDCCHKCESVKYKHTMKEKYGVENSMHCQEFVDKAIKTNIEKYGYKWHMQRPEYQEYYEQVMMERYGVQRALQNDKFKAKMMKSWSENNIAPTSKPQYEIYKILENLYPGMCSLEVPQWIYLLDCVVATEKTKIDVEYDGLYWHQNTKEKDAKRDKHVLSHGYKILRIKGNLHDDIPDVSIIKKKIDTLLFSDKSYEIITM